MSDEMMDDGHEPATRGELRGVRDELRVRLDAHDRRFDGIDGNLRRLNVGFARMEGDITELKSSVGSLLELKGEFFYFKTFLERMNANIETALRKTDLQGSMLMDHEGRIKSLESRPS